jgi:hypothetical protein
MKKLFLLFAAAGLSIGLFAAPPTLTIKKTAVAPTIDGIATDACWNAITAVKILNKKGTDTTTAANFVANASFKMCYDATNIYVLVTALDATPGIIASTTELYKNDCAELFFAMDTNAAAAYRPGDWQIRRVNATADAYDGTATIVAALVADAGFKMKQVDGTATTPYVQEWQFPISILKSTATFDSKNFRFDIQMANANDATAGRVGQTFWGMPTDDQYKVVGSQGYVKMDPATLGTSISKVSSNSVSGYVSNNTLILKNVSSASLVSVVNITGQVVAVATYKNGMNVSKLPAGIYFANTGTSTVKFAVK